jgi:C-terminal processing protease CtpA/Prc
VLKPFRLTILAAVFAAPAPLPAQTVDAPVEMTPQFPLAFPFQMKGTDVTVKFPVMINPTTVLKPGMVLRTLYVIQQSSDVASNDLGLAHATDQSEAYSRVNPSTDGQQKMPYEVAHQLEGYRRTVWTTPVNFELAMAQFPTEAMHLIYVPNANAKHRDLADQRFSFFDGMLMGQPDGSSVVVLAVENDSKADHAGIKAGDEIVAVGNEPTQHDLTTFASVFAAVRENARYNNAATYALTVRSPGQSGTHVVNVAMPPTIKSLLMDGL